jgi:glycosyltransferase involved in cell wall biosynthesis
LSPTKGSLSIVVPAYNQGKFLAQCLDGLIHQTERPLEVLVSPNWSTDSTNEILRQYADYFTIICPEQHCGAAANFNFLISQCKGEWVSLVMADDFPEPIFVEAMAGGARLAEPSTAVLRAGDYIVDSQGKRLRSRSIMRGGALVSGEEAFESMLDGPCVALDAVAFRRDLWAKVGGFDMTMHLYSDWKFWLEMAELGDFQTIPRYVTNYRVWDGPGRGQHRIVSCFVDALRIYEEVILPRAEAKSAGVLVRARAASRRHMLGLMVWLQSADSRGQIVAENKELIIEIGAKFDLQSQAADLVAGRNNLSLLLRDLGLRAKGTIRPLMERLSRWT